MSAWDLLPSNVPAHFDTTRSHVSLLPGGGEYRSSRASRSLHSVRCFLTTPVRVAAFLLVTAFFLFLTWQPLFGSRLTAVTAEALPHPVLIGRDHDLAEVASWTALSHHHHQQPQPNAPDPSNAHAASPPFSCYGVHAQRGRRRYMEDTHAVYLNHQLHYSSATHRHLVSVDTEEGEADAVSPWALFGVFDGHGGALASEYVSSYLLPVLHSSLLRHGHTGQASPLPPAPLDHASSPPLNLTRCFKHTFERMDEEFIDVVARPSDLIDGTTALVAGIYRTDRAAGDVEDSYQLVVANLGDCRAIMVRALLPAHHLVSTHALAQEESHLPPAGDSPPVCAIPVSLTAPGSVTPISTDHKPHLPAERAYIESHPDGFVTISRHGLSRVQGVLSVSRAIGDYPLKPFVRNTPDVHVFDLDERSGIRPTTDEAVPSSPLEAGSDHCVGPNPSVASDLLLLASDGFWDAFTNEEAAESIAHYLADSTTGADGSSPAGGDPASAPPLLSALASHLAKEAYLRGSMDNITVMVVHTECVQRWLREQTQRKAIDAKTEQQESLRTRDALHEEL